MQFASLFHYGCHFSFAHDTEVNSWQEPTSLNRISTRLIFPRHKFMPTKELATSIVQSMGVIDGDLTVAIWLYFNA